MKKNTIFGNLPAVLGLISIWLAFWVPVSAQKLKGEANKLFKNKEYCKALETFEKSIESDESMDNYAFYFMAESACQCGQQTEKAIKFYKKSFAIIMDIANYYFFANDTLNSCFNQTDDWKNSLAEFRKKRDDYEERLKIYLDDLNDRTKTIGESPLTNKKYLAKMAAQDFKTLAKSIHNFNEFPKAPNPGRWVLYSYRVSESLEIPYLVYIPKNYDPRQKTPLYIHLHGAVGRPSFAVKDIGLAEHEASFLESPIKQNAIIIYPMANKDLNWLYHQKAFEAVIGELRQVKSLYNIDDNRIFMTGHSNGGSGSFWFAINMPTEIAAFSAFNFGPWSYNGNTHFGNLRNEYTFYGVSGTEDFLFDYRQISELQSAVEKQGIHWTNYGIKGNHDLPYKTPAEINFLYDILVKQKRNPFPTKLQWETDRAENGRIFWLEISRLDTDKPKEAWQVPIEPHSMRMLRKDIDPNSVVDFYANKSGAVIASIANNELNIKASCVKELVFYVVPQLVNFSKPLKIFVNGKLLFEAKVKPDKKVLLEEFLKTKDRELLVFNKIKLQLN